MVWHILDGVVCMTAGAALCFFLLRWRDKNAREANSAQLRSLLETARAEAEMLTRNARLAADEEALKLRQQMEQTLTARRTENAGQERRLSERETLLNSQLTRLI
jgi:type II secretory pathway component HofQ